MHATRWSAAGLILAVATILQAAHAAECPPLTLLTSIDMERSQANDLEYVPVTVADKAKMMILDTGGVASMITPRTADELNLSRHRGGLRLYSVSNEYSSDYVKASLTLGRLSAPHIDLVVLPTGTLQGIDPRVGGILAPDILLNYDVDIDFGADKLNLISPKHCAGKVIYWPAITIAVVPMNVVESGHIIVPVKLDGHATFALLDTGSTNTILDQPAAEGEFGLQLGSADTPASGLLQNHPGATTYRHTFKLLELEGITVSNPEVEIIPDATRWLTADTATPEIGTRIPNRKRNESLVNMILGMNVLHNFHLYIAYKEQKLYVTYAVPRTAAVH